MKFRIIPARPQLVKNWSLANLNYTALHSKLYYTSQRLACYIRNCITVPHKDWPASSQNHFNPEWMSLLTDLILPRVTMISPSYNDFTESHSLNIRWSSHLRWPARPFTESPTLTERLHVGSILGKFVDLDFVFFSSSIFDRWQIFWGAGANTN